jgi:hypothetical protein
VITLAPVIIAAYKFFNRMKSGKYFSADKHYYNSGSLNFIRVHFRCVKSGKISPHEQAPTTSLLP